MIWRCRLSEPERPLSTADGSLLRAFRAWGGPDFDRASARFNETWRDRLRPAWASALKWKPDVAWSWLRRDHEAASRPDPSRVHPTWFVRALKAESPAIQRAVAAHSPPALREALQRGLGLDSHDLDTDHPPDPEALGWALALWTERLVGDVPDRDDDPPVVVAMTRLNARELGRLIKVCGLAKHAFAIEGNRPTEFDESIARFSTLDRVRLGYFRRHIGVADPRLVPIARRDLQAIEGESSTGPRPGWPGHFRPAPGVGRAPPSPLGLATHSLSDRPKDEGQGVDLDRVRALVEGTGRLGIVGDGSRLGAVVR